MSKRGASNYLTDQNWDQEEEAEEAGKFTPVGEDVMKGRVVKKAKRRVEASGESSDSHTGGGVFKGFGGFGSKITSTAPTFNFGSGTAKPLTGLGGLSNGTSAATSSAPPKAGLFTLAAQKAKDGDSETKTTPSTSDNAKPLTNGSGKSNRYLQQLKCLNEAVSQWIKTHVEKNPYCILTPIFKDYEKHFAEIEKNNPEHAGKGEAPKASTDSAESDSSNVTSSGGSKLSSESTSTSSTIVTSTAPAFKLGGESTFTSSGSGFSFGSPGANTGFSFKSAQSTGDASKTGFSFAVSKPASASTDTANDDEEYVPPKPEVSTVTEEDSKYTVRCKLFYQKEGTWTERGLGNLHLKPCDGKTQLLIRADTNLGNILLNIMVSSSMPTKRLGKNNVLIVCIPNPPINPKDEDKKPLQMMIRVKTSEMADELLKKIEESKQ